MLPRFLKDALDAVQLENAPGHAPGNVPKKAEDFWKNVARKIGCATDPKSFKMIMNYYHYNNSAAAQATRKALNDTHNPVHNPINNPINGSIASKAKSDALAEFKRADLERRIESGENLTPPLKQSQVQAVADRIAALPLVQAAVKNAALVCFFSAGKHRLGNVDPNRWCFIDKATGTHANEAYDEFTTRGGYEPRVRHRDDSLIPRAELNLLVEVLVVHEEPNCLDGYAVEECLLSMFDDLPNKAWASPKTGPPGEVGRKVAIWVMRHKPDTIKVEAGRPTTKRSKVAATSPRITDFFGAH